MFQTDRADVKFEGAHGTLEEVLRCSQSGNAGHAAPVLQSRGLAVAQYTALRAPRQAGLCHPGIVHNLSIFILVLCFFLKNLRLYII